MVLLVMVVMWYISMLRYSVLLMLWLIGMSRSKRFMAIHATWRRSHWTCRLMVSHIQLLRYIIGIGMVVGIWQELLLCVDGSGRMLTAVSDSTVKELDSFRTVIDTVGCRVHT